MGEIFTLEQIANVVDCEHKTAPLVDSSDYHSVRTSDISNGKIDFDNCNRVSRETYVEWTKRAIPKAGDIILAREAPVGEVGFIKRGYKVCLGQRTVLIQVTDEGVDNRYLLYYLASPEMKYELQVRSTGSVVAHLNMKDIRNFEVELPPLPEQQAIASVLSSLDDKIDLLHRQNKTLEALAQTLFRHWFVDGAEDDWEEGVIGDLFTLKRGFDLPVQNRKEGTVPIIAASGINGYHNEVRVRGPGVTTGRSGLLGKVFYVEEDFWPLNTSLFVEIDKTDTPLFVYFLLKTIDLESLNGGSAVPTLNRNDVHGLEVPIPPRELIGRYAR